MYNVFVKVRETGIAEVSDTKGEVRNYNILSVKHILLECPITTELFQKKWNDLNAYNNVRDILYNND